MAADVAVETAAAACEQVLAFVAETLTDCGFTIGTSYVGAGLLAWDDCCGMLVVVPERIYRTARWPAEGPDENNCYGGELAVQLVVLWLACIPTVDDRGRAPSAAALQAAYTEFLRAAAVIWNAMLGLPDEWRWLSTGQSQTFLGTEGGCIGVETRLTVGLDQERWCPPCPEPPGP